MTEFVRCARALVGAREVADFGFALSGGKIEASGLWGDLKLPPGTRPDHEFGPGVIVVPGFINGHSHAYQILLRGRGDDLTFERWRDDVLYATVPRLTPDDVYWTFVVAFSEMLAAGITSVAEFFYLNGAGNDHAEAAIRAAEDSGIRLLLARTWVDAPHLPAAFREEIPVASERTLALMRAHPELKICVAPHSLHAASRDMVAAAGTFARAHDCDVHVHVAEAQYEGAHTHERYGATPIEMLDRLGVLDERLVAIHAIYVSDSEKDLMAQRHVRVVHNPMTNMYLGDGICDTVGLLERGIPVGLGTDADVKPSLIDEMRAASLLQKVARRDGSAMGAAPAWDLGTSGGAAALGIPAGTLDTGSFADFCVLDAQSIDPWSPALNAIVYRADSSWVRETYVAGRRVWNGASSIGEVASQKLRTIAQRLDLGGET
ncbi:MAG: amidohydrolase family protein [Candidatus Eremiobacteraeota bacterium]|nr:amidohydrolase family protein [Candidatus Eremiobacteraeota bacterium]